MDLMGFIIIIFACVVLYLDIFKWNWLSKFRYRKFLYDLIGLKWGEKGVRIITEAIAIVIILSGIAGGGHPRLFSFLTISDMMVMEERICY